MSSAFPSRAGATLAASTGDLRVVYDWQTFCLQEYGGISRYVVKLAGAGARLGLFTPTIVAPLHRNAYLREADPALYRGWRVPSVPRTGRILYQVNRVPGAAMVKAIQPHIVHATYYWSLPRAGSSRSVVTVYDMIHERLPGVFGRRDRTRELKAAAVRSADHVICISNSTKLDLLEATGVPESRVSVVHLGVEDPPRVAVPDASYLAAIPERFVLFVGERARYKNFSNLVRAFGDSYLARQGVELVCLGGGPLSAEERRHTTRHLGKGKPQCVSGSDALLWYLYSKAMMFVYPSVYEGFGIPLLEAMRSACPVACSDISAFREIAGSAAVRFDPNDPGTMTRAMEAIAESDALRADLVQRGLKQAAKFSWERCARMTAEVYARLM